MPFSPELLDELLKDYNGDYLLDAGRYLPRWQILKIF